MEENPVRITSMKVSGTTNAVPGLQALGNGIDTAFTVAIALCEEYPLAILTVFVGAVDVVGP